MIRIICAMCVVCMTVGIARADWAPRPPAMKVAVVPFDVQGEAGHEWLGRAIQEGLATELSGASGMAGVIVPGVAPADAMGSSAMAKSTGADAVIFGSIQVVGDQIRVSGQIISMSTGESLGTLRSDGAQRDLFNIEDLIGGRAVRILTPPRAPSNEKTATAAPATLTVVGPTIAANVPRYFDGNVMSQITPAPKFRDEYDRYYYQTADTSAWAAWCGAAWNVGGSVLGFGGGCGGGCGGAVVATPVSGW